METLLICLLLVYNAYLVFYILKEKRQESKQPEKTAEPLLKQLEKADDIIGKSRFKMETKMPLAAEAMPQVATFAESDFFPDVDITFADETNEPLPVQLPPDKLDEAFSHHLISEMYLEFGDEETDEEDLAPGYAAGISFEEIGDALGVIENPIATGQESHQAGEVFTELDGNEFFQQLIKTSSQRAQRITELMDYFLSNSISRDGDTAGEVVQLQYTTEIPSDISGFDIRDFV